MAHTVPPWGVASLSILLDGWADLTEGHASVRLLDRVVEAAAMPLGTARHAVSPSTSSMEQTRRREGWPRRHKEHASGHLLLNGAVDATDQKGCPTVCPLTGVPRRCRDILQSDSWTGQQRQWSCPSRWYDGRSSAYTHSLDVRLLDDAADVTEGHTSVCGGRAMPAKVLVAAAKVRAVLAKARMWR